MLTQGQCARSWKASPWLPMGCAGVWQLQLCSHPFVQAATSWCGHFESKRVLLRIKHPDGTEVWGCCLDLTFCLGWIAVWGGWKAKAILSKAPNSTDAHLNSSTSALYRQKHRSNLSVLREISTSSQASSLLETRHHKHGGHADLKIHNLWKSVEYEADQTSGGVAVVKPSNV